MRIKEIHILRYRPLHPFHAKFKKNVCIIFGPGGAGKTLIIDAILKMLLGRDAWQFIHHKKIDEMPEGYIVIERKGKEFKLDKEKHLSQFPELELDPEELKNIFVIEDADLEISEEDKFYGRITDKLIGVRTGDIRKIKEGLMKRGRLTLSGQNIHRKSPHYFSKKLEDAENIKNDIINYRNEARPQGLDRLEKEKFDLKWNLARLKERIELLEKAEVKSKFDKLESAFNIAKSNVQALKALPDKESISHLKSRFSTLEHEERRQPQFEREMMSWKERFKYLIISTGLTFIIVVAFGFGFSFTILPSILLLSSFISLYKWHQSDKALAQIETMKQSLVKDAQHIVGIRAKSVEEVEEEITRISKEIEEKEKMFYEAKGTLGELQIEEEDRDRFIEKTKSELTKLRQNIDLDIPVTYDESELRKAKEQKKIKEEMLEKVEEQLRRHQKTMQDFSKRAQRLQFTDEFSNFKLNLEIKNLESLDELARWLDKYTENIQKDAELSKKALDIFKELESKEEAKSEELFESDNLASRIFRDITSRMFEEVSYDSSAGEILVRRSHGKRLQKASELSRSEWAQLYMAIRVALGEKLLKGETSFFIVEEPFIHADSERLLKEFEMLKDYSERGWQTIYFTAKNEIVEELPKHADVEFIELERLP